MSHCVYEKCTTCGEDECVRSAGCSPCRCTRERHAQEAAAQRFAELHARKAQEATAAFKAGYEQALYDMKNGV